MKLTNYILLLFLLFSSSCNELIEYHPNQVILDEDEKDINEKNLAIIREQEVSEPVSFIFLTDTQRNFDELEVAVEKIRSQGNVDFIIHGGDISHFGLAEEFKWVHRILQDLRIPYVTALGNHDLLASGELVYKEMYGNPNFTFDYGFVRFIVFDSNSREYGFNGKVPDLDWLSRQLELPESSPIEQIVLISHVPPFSLDFDPALEEPFVQLIKQHPKVNLSVHGHEHSWSIEKPYGEEVTFAVVTDIGSKGYAKINIWKDDISIEKISF